uniref:Uncharacterized protein n=1 Tax=Arundo donax TaxID=35708 RepID=A0A0A8XZI7_ARUDO
MARWFCRGGLSRAVL